MIVFAIVGAVFTLFGASMLFARRYFEENAMRVWGKVIALEKKISRGSGKNRSKTVTYGPIVEYDFEGQTYWFSCGSSSNGIYKYKIGQRIRLLSLRDGPEYVMLEDGVLAPMGKIFFFIGSCLLGAFVYTLKDRSFDSWFDLAPELIFLIFFVPSFFIVRRKLKSHLKGKDLTVKKVMMRTATLETKNSLKGRDVYYTQNKLNNEISKINSISLAITSVFFAGAMFGVYYFWGRMPDSSRLTIEKLFSENFDLNVLIELIGKENPKVIGFFATSFFSILGAFSFLSSLKKTNTRSP